MKVAIDVVPIRGTGENGGAHHLVLELLQGMARRNRNHEYLLLTAEWNHQYFERFEDLGMKRFCVLRQGSSDDRNVSITSNALISKIISKMKSKLKPYLGSRSNSSLLSDLGVDVLFCPMTAVTYAEVGIPTLSLIYDIQHEYYPQFFSQDELAHRNSFYEKVCKVADSVVCISEFTKQSIVEKYGYPSEKAKVVYISIQDRMSAKSENIANAVLDKYGIRSKIYAFYPANFWAHKNHKMLLTALSMFRHNHPEFDLHLCLTGSLWKEQKVLHDAIDVLGLKDKVHYLGYVPDEELSVVMSRSAFVIFPSLFEGFGIPVAEAMSLGVPVLCSETTSLPEVGGDAALYFDPKKPDTMVERMFQILTNLELQQTCVKRGLEYVKRFNSERMVEEYSLAIESIYGIQAREAYSSRGIYPDHWTEETFEFTCGPSDCSRIVRLSLLLPPVSPVKSSILIVTNGRKRKNYTIDSGVPLQINEEIDRGLTKLGFHVKSLFSPQDIGIPDSRILGIQVLNASVVDKNTDNILNNFHTISTP
ncbi:glycosyltransferase family 4 protein [Paenibacillus antri]|uniref:Glycosyltransferase family 4 protein n=1 Tax=Paenibacillus antri TaxID=2582848 RepID=A0A5R9GF79_9BACL|nr:glycosyltransferase family 1 protein [Paenibacillus antri]TLS52018.1 glycosyltransferase family 4 protein [Paenibacillus antri]